VPFCMCVFICSRIKKGRGGKKKCHTKTIRGGKSRSN
jgi:hypothetical protein